MVLNSPLSSHAGIFYFMTTQELLDKSGLKYARWDVSRVGKIINTKAKAAKITWAKKEQVIQVNDYPDEFVPTMQQILIEFFKSKSQKP